MKILLLILIIAASSTSFAYCPDTYSTKVLAEKAGNEALSALEKTLDSNQASKIYFNIEPAGSPNCPGVKGYRVDLLMHMQTVEKGADIDNSNG